LAVVLCLALFVPAARSEEAAEAADQEDTADGPEAAERLDERLDELLEETLVGTEYGKTSQCLFSRAYRKVRVLNDRVLLFEGASRYWLNRLKRKCVGLTRDMVLMMDHKGSSLCSSDRVRGRRRSSGPAMGTSSCSLGSFEEIDEQYALALIETLRR
jgi:hypothetical protein